MNHWIVVPTVMPGLLAALMVFLVRGELGLQRVVSMVGCLALLAVAVGLFVATADGTVMIYQLGFWEAPFGIVLVVDRLSASMVLLTGVLAPLVLMHVIGSGWDLAGKHFHPLFHFQLMGVTGAFLTSDLFNLFVFFEILLIASYGLMIHGGGPHRMRAGTQYVIYNLLGSTLFLFALGTLYAETGSLNIADLVERIALIDMAENAGIRIAAVLLILVFAVKAALLPLQFWLPSSYSEAPPPSAALFAILTKVGAYAIIRVYTITFPPDLELVQGSFTVWLLPMALISTVVGMVGILSARRLDRLVSFSVIGSMGLVMVAVSLFTQAGVAAALYYIVNSTFATAALFLIVDLVARGRRIEGLSLSATEPMRGTAIVAGLFFVSAIGMAGLPPLSGFVGKLLILDAGFASPLAVWIWAVVLGTSVISITGFSRAGSTLFWKSAEVDAGRGSEEDADAEQAKKIPNRSDWYDQPLTNPLPVVSIGFLIVLMAALTIFAGPAMSYFEATAEQLLGSSDYVDAVMGGTGKELSGEGGN